MNPLVEHRIIEQKRYLVELLSGNRNQKRKQELVRSAKGVLINLYKVHSNGILN